MNVDCCPEPQVDEPPFSPLVPLIVGGAMMIQTINSTVIVNALPSMARHFGTTAVDMDVAITAYLLATAIFLPLSGWMADRFGSRTVLGAAILGYLATNVVCGLSASLTQLIVARVAAGAAAAMMLPVGRIVLLRTVPRGDLVRAMSYLTMPSLLGPVLGPPLGGFITTFGSWRWIFFVNVPVGLVAAVLVRRYLPQVRGVDRPRLDVLGFVLSGCGLAGLILALQTVVRGTTPPWTVMALLAGGAGCLIAYSVHARRVARPIIDFSVLRLQSFTAGVVGGQFARMLNGALPFLLALLLQVSFGLSAFSAGSITFASAAAALLMKTAARPIIRALGFRTVLIGNTVICAAIFASYASFGPGTPHMVIVALLFVGGFFRSLQFTALNTLAYVDMPGGKASSGSTLLSMSQPLAQSFGVAAAAGLVGLAQSSGATAALGAATVAPAFVILAMLSLAQLLFYLPLPRDIGQDVSGHRRRA